LQLLDGVMVGRAVYDHPLRWAAVDALLFGDSRQPEARASTVVRGLIPYAEGWCSGGGRVWAIARHLVQVVVAMAAVVIVPPEPAAGKIAAMAVATVSVRAAVAGAAAAVAMVGVAEMPTAVTAAPKAESRSAQHPSPESRLQR
jgi:tRNA-dihydrouridine synthase